MQNLVVVSHTVSAPHDGAVANPLQTRFNPSCVMYQLWSL